MPLIRTLESCTGIPGRHAWIEDGIAHGTYAFGGLASPGAESRNKNDNSFPPATWGSSDSVSPTHSRSRTWDQRDTPYFETRFESDYTPGEPRRPALRSSTYRSNDLHDTGDDTLNPFEPPQSPSVSSKKLKRPAHAKSISTPHAWAASSKYNDFVPSYSLSRSSNYDVDDDDEVDPLSLGNDDPPVRVKTPKPELINSVLPRDGVARAIALYDFKAVEVIVERVSLGFGLIRFPSLVIYRSLRAMLLSLQRRVIVSMIGVYSFYSLMVL
jgi:SH3 domain-containing YSC84-like protein 1